MTRNRAGQTLVLALPTAITLLALLSGTLSLFASLQSLEAVNPEPHRLTAALLIMAALILDGLDGNVARLLKAESTLGGELDTFVDLTAFGIAPALLIYGFASGFPESLRIGLGCLLIASGAYRLARFKTVDPYRGQRGYLGLPITVCAAMTALFQVLAIQAPAAWGQLKVDPASGPVASLFLGFVALLALLQVSHFHFPKPSKSPYFFLPGLILVFLLFTPWPALAAGCALAGLLFGLLYVGLSPLLPRPPPARE